MLAAPQDAVAEDDDANTAQAFKRTRSQHEGASQNSNEQLRLEHEYLADYENFLDMAPDGPDDDNENLPLSQPAAATFPGASPDVVRCSREPGTPPLSQPAAVTFPGASPDVVHCSRVPAAAPAAAAAVLGDDGPLVQPAAVAAALRHPP